MLTLNLIGFIVSEVLKTHFLIKTMFSLLLPGRMVSSQWQIVPMRKGGRMSLYI